MRNYRKLVENILATGEVKADRTGTGTFSIFGEQLRFNLKDGFPLLTLKYTHWHSILGELLWFLSGSSSVIPLQEDGIHIWDEWADPFTGELGPIYGVQWRTWAHMDEDGLADIPIDQITNLIEGIKTNPDSRRHLVTAWNPAELDMMKLPPCHYSFQAHVSRRGELSLLVNMRSVDVFLGLPFNIASYAALTHMLAQVCNLEVGELIMNLGDTHIYKNHTVQAQEMLERSEYPLPSLYINPDIIDIDDFKPEHFNVQNYTSHKGIKAPIAV